MRCLVFWAGLASAALCAMLEPGWGYAAVFVLALAQLALLGERHGSVFLLVHYTTILTYFSLAPALQIATDTAFWGAGTVPASAHRQALALLLSYMAGVELARLAAVEVQPAPPAHRPTGQTGQTEAMARPAALLLLQAVAFAVMLAHPDLNFLARGELLPVASEPFALIAYSTLPKLAVLLCCVALVIQATRQRGAAAWLMAGLALVLAAVAANPVNTARQILLVGLLPLLIHYFGRRGRWMLALALFGAVAGLGPVLNLVSRGAMWGEGLSVFPYSEDFDAMYVLAVILERAPDPAAGWGRYLLSAASFMLPRDLKLWPDFDPLGWPAVAANFSQTNLSLPHFATAYLDFGLAGPMALGWLLSAAYRRADRAIAPGAALDARYLAALVMVAAYVPLMRGPILGWGPFAASGVIAALAVGLLGRSRTPPPPLTHPRPTAVA